MESKKFYKYYLLYSKYNVFDKKYEKLKRGFNDIDELNSYKDFIKELYGNLIVIKGVVVNEGV